MNKPRPHHQQESLRKTEEISKSSAPSGEILDPLEEQLNRQVGDLLPVGSRQEILRRITTVVHSEQFSGPIAHPRHLREYEEVQKGSADRIIGMAEKQQNHQITMEKLVVEKEYGDRRWGMLIAAGIFVLLIGCALASALAGKELASGLFLAAGAIGGVVSFVDGRKDKR